MSRPTDVVVSRVLCVTPNPAVDVTYRVGSWAPGASHRVRDVLERPGGKGVNVARVLRVLGVPAVVVAPLGGPGGDWLAAELRAGGHAVRAVPVAAATRRTVTVVDDTGAATAFNEPGRALSEDEWSAFVAAVAEELGDAVALVVSGSLPAGAPSDLLPRLVAAARDAGVPAVADTSGPALLTVAGAGPALVKPNAHELAEALPGDDGVSGAAGRLLALGAERVVVSLGADGLLGVDGSGGSGESAVWRVAGVPGVAGNPTGAGDATVAALVRGLVAGTPWPEALTDAAALGAAAVLAAAAGEVDLAAYERFLPTLHAERVE
ncbi:1-phosphofructokinase family hexose kinase [Jiangella mangrovi]|uniref:1-phosphofructokinase family hexose kinase n=1 Tax=Jiangella mangrovi TaxID=1524084 RepID=A0A7W9GMS7_9ACTN|nr:hexose kinase [Jiangella mangrovi]MBB5786541.1 1-phosphofructokinase family hexose kinase [Jiangella mangrovi]